MSVTSQRRLFHRPRIRENSTVKVGFLQHSTYPDGKKVSEVAFSLEFGTGGHFEYAFFRKANEKFKGRLNYIIRQAFRGTNQDTPSDIVMGRIATQWQQLIQEEITEEKERSGHLVDTGLMRQSVSYEVES